MAYDASGADYQVFLSFRGPDTRQGFTDCLYHFLVDAGVRVFRDNEEIRPGDKIEVILTAIKNSTVCIPIFSKGFASSKWCLRELSEMVKLKKIILPVFFDISPDDLKLETPLYRDALLKHGDGTEKGDWEMALKEVLEVSGWKSNDQGQQALKEVVKIKGWELRDKGYAKLCKTIVPEVLNNLKVRDRIVSDYLVGMEDQIESVQKLLDMNAPGKIRDEIRDKIRYVLIHGIGGSGKTTLAKTVFNRFNSWFEHCSFLSDVRELSERHGVKYLQKQLLADTCRISKDISSSDEGIKAIRDMLTNKKVLIVLDDVDKREQIEKLIPNSGSLKSGSRVIITTRDERVLVSGLELSYTLKMEELDTGRALQLFSIHAFGLNFPPLDFLDLSKEVVTLSSHLPLYLEIAGAHLNRKSRKEWNTYIIELGKVPEKKVQEKLMISYNSLDIRTREIFLDIACFFVNKEKRDAMYMWEACGFHPDSGLDELTSKSMVKVIDGSKLWMHDFMRDLGREIVCRENLIDPGERSRLWIHKEALGILERKEGTRKVQALCLSPEEQSKRFTYENFKKLMNLRFLEWSGPNVLEGKFEHLFSKLRWLSWHNCPSNFEAEMLNLENLVIFDLSGSNISEHWVGWSQTNMGCNLKVLNLTNCVKLTKTPDLSKLTGLERLILSGCTQLTEIDCSICMLKHLDLTNCVKLTKTPDLSKLTGLERLILSGCTQLTEIDCSIRMATSLTHLDLTNCLSLQGLPEEVGSIDALEELFMAGGGEAHSFSLPESIGNLVRLSVLELRKVQMTELPESICKLKRLTRLVLEGCRGINKFPDLFGDLESLVTLDAGCCRDLCELPDSIGSLKQLKVLNLRRTLISKLPSTIGDLESLVTLDAGYCEDLCELPDSIGSLKQLRVIDLQWTQISQLPSTIGTLEQLEELNANTARKLSGAVPCEIDRLLRLRYLDFSSTAIQVLPSLSKISHLQKLRLLDCNKLLEVPELPASLTDLEVWSRSVQKISFDFSSLNSLVNLLWACPIVGLPWSEQSCAPKNLSRLILGKLRLTNDIPKFSTMKNVSFFRLAKCQFGESVQCLGVGEMKSLKDLEIYGCNFKELNRNCLPENLERLVIHNCRLLTLLDVSHLRKLKSWSISGCELLKETVGLAELKSIQSS